MITAGRYNFLLTLWQTEKPTVLLVSHDLEETYKLSNRVIELKGSPVTQYEEIIEKQKLIGGN